MPAQHRGFDLYRLVSCGSLVGVRLLAPLAVQDEIWCDTLSELICYLRASHVTDVLLLAARSREERPWELKCRADAISTQPGMCMAHICGVTTINHCCTAVPTSSVSNMARIAQISVTVVSLLKYAMYPSDLTTLDHI